MYCEGKDNYIYSASLSDLIIDTSRKRKEGEWDGQSYIFVSRPEMEQDIKAARYLEHGEYEGNLYGTKISSIQEVVTSGKMCVLDVNPQVRKTKKHKTQNNPSLVVTHYT